MTNDSRARCQTFSMTNVVFIFSLVIMIVLGGCGDNGKTSYTVNGTVTLGGTGLSGVTVTVAGNSAATATTDAGGNYSFTNLSAGNYTVTPSLTGYAFSPSYRDAFLNSSDAIGWTFGATFDGRLSAALHTMFLKTDGTVWTWGYNSNGQLGNGTTANSANPVQAGALSGVKYVAAGGFHSVVMKTDGTVWTWGYNSNGQLGNGIIGTDSYTPAPVSTLSGVMTDIAAGDEFTVVVKSDGTVWAWGDNSVGQLGNGTTVANSIIPVQVSTLTGVTTVIAGSQYAAALKSDGTVWTWGMNSVGQLGNGTTTNSSIPVQVGGVSGITAIAGGDDFVVALKNFRSNSTAWAWGNNSSGQLGNGTMNNSLSPVQVSALTNVAAIAAGTDHTNVTAIEAGTDHVVIMKSDGTVWAWGNNSNGQLGNGTTVNSSTPIQTSGMTGAAAIIAGLKYTLTLKNDGTIWAWGYNNAGQLGDGTTTDRWTPVQAQSP
jgi:alpha-tubulin suppressor-like RCC1 family protein